MPGIQSAPRLLMASAAVILFYACFYRVVLSRCGPLMNALIGCLRLDTTWSVRQVDNMGKLAIAGVAQALFAYVLMRASGVDAASMITAGLRPGLVLAGAILGLGELALAALLCSGLLQLLVQVQPASHATSLDDWSMQARGGWMGQFTTTGAVKPFWPRVAGILLYVSTEELIFRAIFITLLNGAGAGWAVGASLMLFVLVQAFNMPNIRAALFPIVGASVVGFIHGMLYWQTRAIIPLVVAHLTFFFGALGMLRRPSDVVHHRSERRERAQGPTSR